MFKVGDRVQVKTWAFCGVPELHGQRGTVICVRPSSIGVDFDNDFDHAHDCDGMAKHGRWGDETELIKLNEDWDE